MKIIFFYPDIGKIENNPKRIKNEDALLKTQKCANPIFCMIIFTKEKNDEIQKNTGTATWRTTNCVVPTKLYPTFANRPT